VNTDPTAFPFGDNGDCPDPGPPPVGAFVEGAPTGQRQLVRWSDQFRDHHELAEHVHPDGEAYLSLYCYPARLYCAHFKAAGYSPAGYAGPAGCRYLMFDIDRANDLGAALDDARSLVRFLLSRYAPHIDDGIGVYFSGSKGFHVLVELLLGAGFTATVPATCKRLALSIAAKAGVRIDSGCFDHQRLVRLPNSKHPATGLHKRFLTTDELFALDVGRITELAKHPAAFPMPSSGEFIPELEADWQAVTAEPDSGQTPPDTEHPTVPKYVRDFIGFQDVQDPGRALTVYRCAAVLAEAGTPDAVIRGLLEEPAYKTGLEAAEVTRQIATGIERGKRKRGAA
jgi:hypothetical protein